MRIALLTSSTQWFEPYANKLAVNLNNIPVFNDHNDLHEHYDILFILSYHHIIDSRVLNKNKHNIVVHSSALPAGKGWAPLFWQILEGENKIPFSLFEATEDTDNGDIYFQSVMTLTGYELNEEIRHKQAEFIIQMCLEFIDSYDQLQPTKQQGSENFYPKRGPEDSQLDIHKTINEQFNLLRIVSNEEYPAFFEKDGQRYTLTIQKVTD